MLKFSPFTRLYITGISRSGTGTWASDFVQQVLTYPADTRLLTHTRCSRRPGARISMNWIQLL
uniref:Putative ovule protein n=1 Tax=Solanum chacoense TaxID=4108 RepID=A0A0V0GUY8_SOLCH